MRRASHSFVPGSLPPHLTAAPPRPAVHPLDPLGADEIRAVAAACRKHAESLALPFLRFNVISLQEPPKRALVAYDAAPSPATLPPRQAFAVLQTPPEGGAIEAVLTLTPEGPVAVESWVKREGVQPLASPDDCFDAEAIAKADPEVIELLATKYGLTDLDLVVCDPWSVHMPPEHLKHRRLIQTFMYVRAFEMDNAYAHPLDFVPVVDLNEKKVVHIDRPYGDAPPPVPAKTINYAAQHCEKPPRTGLTPINVVQPEGVSFSVDGNRVRWQRWDLRLSFNYREGLVIHNVGYEDGGRVRPVVHRLSAVEMAVPYGDPHAPFTRKCAFDVGDYGLGNCTTSLALGCDCLGDIFYFDAVLADSKGEPVVIKKAVCMHEEDAGLAWKHVEYRNGHNGKWALFPPSASCSASPRRPSLTSQKRGACAAWCSPSWPPSSTTSIYSTCRSTPTAPSTTRSSSPANCPPTRCPPTRPLRGPPSTGLW